MTFLVAVEACDGGVKEYWRKGSGQVVSREVEFYPWALVPEKGEGSFTTSLPHSERLDGDGYNTLLTFENWRNFYNFKKLLKGRNDAIAYSSPAKNFLVSQSYRMFENAKFDDVVRLAVDIETTGLDPCEDELLLLTYRSNRGHEGFIDGSEEDILRGFVSAVNTIDPDILEGHNVLGFDFNFLHVRAELAGIGLRLGRDGSRLRLGRERSVMIGPNERTCTPVYIHGRHVVDTYIAVQKFDIASQKLSSYGLKECARAFGIASEGRIEVDRSKMRELWESDRDTIITYALQDVEENLKLGNIVLPVEFMQTTIVPDGYSGVALTGNGEKVDSILVAEYLRRGKAIPIRRDREEYVGGFVECREHGVFSPIVKADVESLYPSLMLTMGIKPSSDTEDVFLPTLKRILTDRLTAKRKVKEIERRIGELKERIPETVLH